VGLSISRVGGQAQPKILREVVGGIRLALAQHKQLQKLSQLETVVSQEAQKKIYRGELTLELLKQVKHTNVSPAEQTLLFYAAEEGAFDDIEKEKWAGFEKMTLELARSRYRPLMEKIRKGSFGEIEKKAVQEMIEDLKREYLSEKP
jgi:F-type H+-transporting ATPase subunit alpha